MGFQRIRSQMKEETNKNDENIRRGSTFFIGVLQKSALNIIAGNRFQTLSKSNFKEW